MDAYRLFLPAQFTEAPTWIPFLPKPGSYNHPKYGKLDISHAGNAEAVSNFRAAVYQRFIPLDAEHQTKLSGAVGYLSDMRLNPDGSADAQMDWTDRGRALIGGGAFRYVSPELYQEWSDPATGKNYKNVIIGGALTTRPFFKESSLRPLVATEHGLQMPDDQTERRHDTMPTMTFSEAEDLVKRAANDVHAYQEYESRKAEINATIGQRAQQRAEQPREWPNGPGQATQRYVAAEVDRIAKQKEERGLSRIEALRQAYAEHPEFDAMLYKADTLKAFAEAYPGASVNEPAPRQFADDWSGSSTSAGLAGQKADTALLNQVNNALAPYQRTYPNVPRDFLLMHLAEDNKSLRKRCVSRCHGSR
jgi:hypothetical protein